MPSGAPPVISNAPPVPSGLVVVIANDDNSGNPQPLNLTSITDPKDSFISGVAFQIDWRDIEPHRLPMNPNAPIPIQDAPDWSRLDAVFKAADAAGKWVQLLIVPGFFSPSWVLAPFKHVKTDQFPIPYGQGSGTNGQIGPAKTLPISWNQTYLNEWFAFLARVKLRYESNPEFRMIAAAGPTSVSDEMTEPDNAKPATHDISNWKADKYTPKKYIDAWKMVFNEYKKDFPLQYVSLSHGNDVPSSERSIRRHHATGRR